MNPSLHLFIDIISWVYVIAWVLGFLITAKAKYKPSKLGAFVFVMAAAWLIAF